MLRFVFLDGFLRCRFCALQHLGLVFFWEFSSRKRFLRFLFSLSDFLLHFLLFLGGRKLLRYHSVFRALLASSLLAAVPLPEIDRYGLHYLEERVRHFSTDYVSVLGYEMRVRRLSWDVEFHAKLCPDLLSVEVSKAPSSPY